VRAALLSLLAALAATIVPIAASSEQAEAEPEKPRLNCQAGPVERYFDGVQWNVFACDDGASIVVVTGPKSPSDLSFYFIIYPKDGTYKLHGEGNGDKDLTRPAYEALSAMSDDDFRALHAEATAVVRTDSPYS
jgi:hypothetical protein